MLRLFGVMAGFGAHEIRAQMSRVKVSFAVGACILVFALTAWAAAIIAVALYLVPFYGALTTALVIGAAMLALILVSLIALAIFNKTRARRVARNRRSLAQSATTMLAFAPLLSRVNPVAAIGIAVGAGAIMSWLTSAKADGSAD